MPPRRFKYHAALSFAGENRRTAESLFRSLSERGYRVFYDADREAHLWGRDSKEFQKIYGDQSRYVIPIISKHYARKEWTRYEFDIAKREQRKRRSEFILPVCLDDTPLLGLPDGVIHQDGRKKSAEELAETFARKLQSPNGARPSRSQRGHRHMLALLNRDFRTALELIEAAAMPLRLEYFEKLFPEYGWKQLIPSFRKRRLLRSNPALLKLSSSARTALGNDKARRNELNQLWIERLTPLARHYDIAALLCIHLLRCKRIEDVALLAVAHVGDGLSNRIYTEILGALSHKPLFAKLSRSSQVAVLNGFGTSLCNAGRHEEAMACFEDLRKRSRRYRDSWGIGQSWINAGVAAAKMGDAASAERLYWKAVKHGTRTRDSMLAGRALNNLAQLYVNRDIDRAEALLRRSIRAKMIAKDRQGLVVGLAVRGTLAAARGKFDTAARLFQRSSRMAAELGLHYEYALSTYNRGRAVQDSGKPRTAQRFYRRAIEIARPYDYLDIIELALNALSANAFQLKQYGEAHLYSCELLELSLRTTHSEYEISALHACAMSSLAEGRQRDSRAEFRRAIRRAKELGSVQWAVRCLVDSTRGAGKGLGDPSISRLQRLACSEASAKQYSISAELWVTTARFAELSGADQVSSDAFAAADKALASARDTSAQRLDLYRTWFSWAWKTWRTDEGMQVLKRMERLAARVGDQTSQFAATDQRGVCLQELEQFSAAETLHRATVCLARRAGDILQEERSLNNLGEALRRQGRDSEAIGFLEQSEKISRATRNYEGAIAAAHNRALAMAALGRTKHAEKVLQKCTSEAARHGLWAESVRVWEGLANLAWEMGNLSSATQLYRRSLEEARKHGVQENVPRVALNLARVLATQKKYRVALEILKAHRPAFGKTPEGLTYLKTLADLYEQTGMLDDALRCWTAVSDLAVRLGVPGERSSATVQYERLLDKAHTEKATERSILSKLRRERTPDKRLKLLMQQISILFRKRARQRAQSVLNKALALCAKHELLSQKAQLYIHFGNHELQGSHSARRNAFRAYLMAMATGIKELQQDNSGTWNVALDIVQSLTSPDLSITQNEMNSLLTEVRGEVSKQGLQPGYVYNFLLWPFELARDLFPLRDRPIDLLAKLQELTNPEAMTAYLGRFETAEA